MAAGHQAKQGKKPGGNRVRRGFCPIRGTAYSENDYTGREGRV